MRAFIIRPFGTRRGIDFDAVENNLIAPALQNIGAEGRTTGEILEAGNIRIDMFQQLLISDLVIADITTNNPNAFYELGIRHALQEKRTFLIRAKLPRPETVDQLKEVDVPFDLKTDRYFEYDPANSGASLEKLTDALRETTASNRQDSPVFLSLPSLKSQSRESFIPVPLGFGIKLSMGIYRSPQRRPRSASHQTLRCGADGLGEPAQTRRLRPGSEHRARQHISATR